MNSVIDLTGLIAEDVTLYNKILDAYYTKMYEVSASSLIHCNIKINNIELKNSNNCNISVNNKCFSNSFLSLNILIETIIESLEFISDNIRNRIEKNLGIILEPGADQSDSALMKRCNIESQVSNSIKVGTLVIKNCFGQQPLSFEFYNTGDAKANCGIVELIKSLSTKIDEEETDNTLAAKFDFVLNKVFSLKLLDFFYILCLIVFLLVIILLVTNFVIHKKVLFKSNTSIK